MPGGSVPITPSTPGPDNSGRAFIRRIDMTPTFVVDIPERAAARAARPVQATSARDLYFALMDNPAAAFDAARGFLRARIEEARAEPADLPEAPWQLQGWIESRAETVGIAYREYLAARKNGAPRRYFTNK